MEGPVIVRFVNLPRGARAVTVKDADGVYNVYISVYADADTEIAHERVHIEKDDFENDIDIRKVEAI